MIDQPIKMLARGTFRVSFDFVVRGFLAGKFALKQSIGVLYLAAAPGKYLRDRNLLADIGSALGLSLDNLRQ